MKVIKKYTAIKLGTQIVNDTVNVELSYGEITGSYYNTIYPIQEFDTEEEAISYAYKIDKHIKWLIVPLIQFDAKWDE